MSAGAPEIAHKIHESGRAFERHQSLILPKIDLSHANVLIDDTGTLGQLLDCGAGIDAFGAYRGGRGVAGIAIRAQSAGVYRTITWRNGSTRSELARSCQAYLANDGRLRPDWVVHMYEDGRKLWGFVAAHADDLARYFLEGLMVGNAENHSDNKPFAIFPATHLAAAGVDVREWWCADIKPDQPVLGSSWRLR